MGRGAGECMGCVWGSVLACKERMWGEEWGRCRVGKNRYSIFFTFCSSNALEPLLF